MSEASPAPSSDPTAAPDERIPVTVLTGFLGSGKTTLLNRILSEQHRQKIAVIENEYGELGIDHELVINADEEVFELSNGCICCTVRGDLVRVFEALRRRRERFDRVLLETTGLADPGPVAQTFFADEEVKKHFRLDAIVTVVDAKHVAQHLDDSPECRQQVAFADVLVLNKTDLVSADELAAVRARVSGVNVLAKVYEAERGNVPLDAVLGVRGFDLARGFERAEGALAEAGLVALRPRPSAGASTKRSLLRPPSAAQGARARHDTSVRSIALRVDGALDGERFKRWLNALLASRGPDLYRFKGLLHLAGAERRSVFHGVHMTLEAREDRAWAEGEARYSKLVFIGRDLDRDALEAGVRGCLS